VTLAFNGKKWPMEYLPNYCIDAEIETADSNPLNKPLEYRLQPDLIANCKMQIEKL
jgi:hypothetical protein